jgi:hypothetical protein
MTNNASERAKAAKVNRAAVILTVLASFINRPITTAPAAGRKRITER